MSIIRQNSVKEQAEVFSRKKAELCDLTVENSCCHCLCNISQLESGQSEDGKMISTSIPKTLYLSYLIEGTTKVYHITALKDNCPKDKSPLFLTIPLFDPIGGSLKYHIISNEKHQASITRDGKQKDIIFDLKGAKLSANFTHIVAREIQKLCREKLITAFKMSGEQLDPPSPCSRVAPTDIESMQTLTQGPFNRQRLSYIQVQEISKTLMAAISMGNVSQASQLAARLAEEKIKIEMEVNEESITSQMKTFNLNVHVEDRQTIAPTIKLQVFASDTIGQLKQKLLIRYQFPIDVQKWIVKRKIPQDHETLRLLDVRGPGYTVFVYIMKAKSVNLDSPSTFPRRQGAQGQLTEVPPGDYVHMSNTLGAQRQHSNQSANSNSLADNTAQITVGPTVKTPRKKSRDENNPYVPMATPTPTPAPKPTPKPSVRKKTKAVDKSEGWECSQCTYINPPTRPGCELCTSERPGNYRIPEGYVLTEEEKFRKQHDQELERQIQEVREEEERLTQNRLLELLQTDNIDLISNSEEFDCPICFDHIEIGEGVVLRDCLHMFCRECLMGAAQYAEEAELKCPFQDENYTCESVMQEREIRSLVDDQIFQQILKRSLTTAESQATNSYHCASTDCHGWCIYEDLVNFFSCPVCKKENCLTCKAIHEGQNCKQYQENVQLQASKNINMKETKEYLETMVSSGNAMNCPQCGIIIMKKDGCDWIKCSCCKTEICWVTKGRRWGPMGEGDTTGGCRCRVNNKQCHVNCNNCH